MGKSKRTRNENKQQDTSAESQQQQQQQQRHETSEQTRQVDDGDRDIYDQNRNLNLNENEDKKREMEQQLAVDDRVSPVLSLADSECTDPSACSSSSLSSGGVDARSRPSQSADCGSSSRLVGGAQSASESGSSSGSTQLVCSPANSVSNDDQHSQQQQQPPPDRAEKLQHIRPRRVSFSGTNNTKHQVLIDMFDLRSNTEHHKEPNAAAATTNQLDADDQSANEHDKLATINNSTKTTTTTGCAGCDDRINNHTKETLSFVNQIGRHVSLLPSFLARRSVTGQRRANNGNQQRRRAEYSTPNNSSNNENGSEHWHRRFSLQLPALLRAGSSSASSSLDGRAASAVAGRRVSASASEPVPTVAGVGGTVTTVTRKTRKTAPLPRLVAKNGHVNLFFDNIDRRQYFRDLFVTMIDIKWRYNLAAAAFGFVLSWLFFACIWYVVLFIHDDLNHENDPNWSPCIVNVYSFAAALLFSIETQSTLGFGSRIISVECPAAIVIFCLQLIFGVVIECLIVGMVFAKLSRPAKRSQTIMYSKCATICLREDQLCLTFRVGDVRSKSHIIGATIRASLVSQKITREGEIIPFCHTQLNVTIDNSNSLLLIWPVTIVHVIDETSPFYELSSQQLTNFKFELITVLEGTVESTGQSIQVRSSYLPSEVKWGYRFEPIVSAHGFGCYAQTIIDYNKFNRVLQVDMPTCSARDYYAQRQAQRLNNNTQVELGCDNNNTQQVCTNDRNNHQ